MYLVTRSLNHYSLMSLVFLICIAVTFVELHAQGSNYSQMAQRILDENNNDISDDTTKLEVFKFTVNEIVNSAGDSVENAAGDPTLFGRTDYGSEFVFSNDLSTSFKIEVPAFVIDVLAEDETGDYFPVIKNGDNDLEDGTYSYTYNDDDIGAQVTEYLNADSTYKIDTLYDYGTREIDYPSENGIDVKDYIYEDGAIYKTFFIDDELDVLASTYNGLDGYSSRYYVDADSDYSYSTSTDAEGDVYTSYYDGTNSGYSETVNVEGITTSSNYYEQGISLNESILETGLSEVTYNSYDTDGNYHTVTEYKDIDGSITRVEYSDQNTTASEDFVLDSVTNSDTAITSTYKSNSNQNTLVKIQTGNDISLSYNDEEFFSYISQNKDNIVSQATNVIENGEQIILNGTATVTEANNVLNPNSLSIDFKEQYDSENGQAITPEMGYVRLSGTDGNEYINLSNGDIVEFFVKPNDTYLEKHNSTELFFIDRPIPETPIITEVTESDQEYGTNEEPVSEEQSPNIAPGEDAVILPSGEVKIYVTTVYVQAPASSFQPTQIVMPVNADGDYNYDIEPAAAETFPDEIEVVAIPDEEVENISKKVEEIKKARQSSTNPKRENERPILDVELEPIIKLQKSIKDVSKNSERLLLEAKNTIQREYPNMSAELINFIVNSADINERHAFIENPKEFFSKEFSKFNDIFDLTNLLNANLSQKNLKKIYNLLLFEFSNELGDLGFEILKDQKVNFSDNFLSPEKLLERVELINDLTPIMSLLGSSSDGKDISELLIDPAKINQGSSAAIFENNSNQNIFGQLKRYSNIINLINNPVSSIAPDERQIGNQIPTIEINVGMSDNIAEALKEKLEESKQLNTPFRNRNLSSKLEKFNFEIPPPVQSTDFVPASTIIAEGPIVSEQELQLVAETTEATNYILNETIEKMLSEIGENSTNTDVSLSTATVDEGLADGQNAIDQEDKIFVNALSAAKRLNEIEDIRAVFEIFGIGS